MSKIECSNIDELQDNAPNVIAWLLDVAEGEGKPMYSRLAHSPETDPNGYSRRFNFLDTTPDGFFLIVSDWDEVAWLGKRILDEYPFVTDEPGCDVRDSLADYDFAEVLNSVMDRSWGFADEYVQCDSCGCPVRYADADFIIENGELTCYDCLSDEYYVEEYLPYTTEIRDEMAGQETTVPHINTKLSDGELRAAGYELCREDLLYGMYEGWRDDPIATIESLPEGYTYIFSYRSASDRYNPYGSSYEIWSREIPYE